MRHHRVLFERVRDDTTSYLRSEKYDVVAAYVAGFDAAYEGGLLLGFQQWLVLRLRKGSNVGWPSLVLHLAFPGIDTPDSALDTDDGNRHATRVLFELIFEFDEVRRTRTGLRNLLIKYEAWAAERGVDDPARG